MANRMYLTPETLQCALHTAQCTLQSGQSAEYSTSTSASTVPVPALRY